MLRNYRLANSVQWHNGINTPAECIYGHQNLNSWSKCHPSKKKSHRNPFTSFFRTNKVKWTDRQKNTDETTLGL